MTQFELSANSLAAMQIELVKRVVLDDSIDKLVEQTQAAIRTTLSFKQLQQQLSKLPRGKRREILRLLQSSLLTKLLVVQLITLRKLSEE